MDCSLGNNPLWSSPFFQPMLNTDKASCLTIAHLLAGAGVKRAILCSGSRSVPIALAIFRHKGIDCQVVIDERCAAFMALGMAVHSSQPVAVVCTSGTALLNMAPALAEALYRQAPVIAISADRPLEWIDQDDSQTIRQYLALDNIVKASFDVPVERGTKVDNWYINRTVNDAIIAALQSPKGPVHLNVQLDVPLSTQTEQKEFCRRVVTTVYPDQRMSDDSVSALAAKLSSKSKVMIVAGFMAPCAEVSAALREIAESGAAVVMHEAQANVHPGIHSIAHIDSVLSTFKPEDAASLAPDLVVTIGGSLVSRYIKRWLRGTEVQHWHVGHQPRCVDPFMALDCRIDIDAACFLPVFAQMLRNRFGGSPTPYFNKWDELRRASLKASDNYDAQAPWSDYTAMRIMMQRMPSGCNLHLSNGTSVRYAQLFPYGHIGRIDCNRGVSGIDGCTSTAIGAALSTSVATILITGDMSAQYDLGALACAGIPANFKMAVLNNQGGGIFRFIESTSSLPEREQLFCADVRLPLRDLAKAFGFNYFEAESEGQLCAVWEQFVQPQEAPAMLNVVTDGQLSADVLKNYFKVREAL